MNQLIENLIPLGFIESEDVAATGAIGENGSARSRNCCLILI